MPFIETYETIKKTPRYWRGKKFRINKFKCDGCGIDFERSFNALHTDESQLSFCNKECIKKSQAGVLTDKRLRNSQTKYGCHYTQLESTKKKMIDTRVERYGTTAPVQHNAVSNEKYKKTMLERYGTDTPLPAARAAFEEKYGHVNPWQLPDVRARNDLTAAGQKGYRALYKKMGSSMLSKPERELGEWLISCYGHDDVEGQAAVDHGGTRCWLIDYYVKSIDTYVLLDGIFWHGLDRPLEELAMFPKTLKQYERDREQDRWFFENGLRLVRVTDQEWNECHRSGNYDVVLKRLGG